MKTLSAKSQSVHSQSNKKSIRLKSTSRLVAFQGHPLGNLMIQGKPNCACGGQCPRCIEEEVESIQPKLKIISPNDKYEQEADRIADQIVRNPYHSNNNLRQNTINKNEGYNIQSKSSHSRGWSAPSGFSARLANSKGSGRSMSLPMCSSMENAFRSDLSQVRIHTDSRAAEMNQMINAEAFTHGKDIYFAQHKYQPDSRSGQHLLAHELVHVHQQNGLDQIHRNPTFNDASCTDSMQENIRSAWPISVRWVQHVRSNINDTSRVGSLMRRHFKVDPSNTAHATAFSFIRDTFNQINELLGSTIDNRCTPPNRGSQCHLDDGRRYGAYVHRGRPEDGIWFCTTAARTGRFSRANLIGLIVHEVAHLTRNNIADNAYRSDGSDYRALSQDQAIHNADCYSEFAQALYMNRSRLPIRIPISLGTMISSGTPQWVIRASLDVRTQTGIEIFDLIGGVHYFMGLDGDLQTIRTHGVAMDIGVLSRSPDTNFFADTRVGGFYTISGSEIDRAGPTLSTTIGWAGSGFRAGFNVRALFDILQQNHAAIIGGEFGFEF